MTQSTSGRISRRTLLQAIGAAALLPVAGAAAEPLGASATTRTVQAVSLARVRAEGAALVRLLEEFDVPCQGPSDGWYEVVLRAGDATRLRGAGYRFEITVPDLIAQFVADRAAERAHAQAAPQARTSYRTYPEYLADLDRLAAIAPGIAKRFTLPAATHESRPIEGVEIGADIASAATDGRATALLWGVHHAREWPSGELTIMFAEDLVDRALKGEADTLALLDGLRLIVIPICNPDGFVRSRDTVPYTSVTDTAVSLVQEGPYHRKNMRRNTSQPVETGQGVDINRNYSYRWGGVGASATTSSQTYHGPGPGSEPEIVALGALLRGTQVLTGISNHTHGRLVLRPWGYTNASAPDEPALKALGDRMASFNGYTSGKWNVALYPGTGIIDDWAYGNIGTYCYTLEHGSAFHPVYSDNVPQQYAANRPAFLEMVAAAKDPAHHGILHGTAPAGTVLTLRKSVVTPLSKSFGGSMTVAEELSSSITVGPDGAFEWHVNPSPTAHTLLDIAAGKLPDDAQETYTLTAHTPDGSETSLPLLVERGRRYPLSF